MGKAGRSFCLVVISLEVALSHILKVLLTSLKSGTLDAIYPLFGAGLKALKLKQTNLCSSVTDPSSCHRTASLHILKG